MEPKWGFMHKDLTSNVFLETSVDLRGWTTNCGKKKMKKKMNGLKDFFLTIHSKLETPIVLDFKMEGST